MTRRAIILALVLAIALVAAAPAGAHHSGSQAAGAALRGVPVKLRDCYLTAAFAPRPAAPLDFGMPFYGPDPLVGVWGLACDRSRVDGRRAGRLVLSLVGVPVGLTSPDAVPLANNFAHRLLWLHTSSPRLAAAARRAGLRATVVRARYRHSRQGRVPFSGRLSVPGSHAIAVSASLDDPTNPHDHANVFKRRGGAGLGMTIDDAFDRFCLSPGQGCSASLRAERGSRLARLLGATSAPVRAAFDHDELRRVDLTLG
jgi:hypothetical protein